MLRLLLSAHRRRNTLTPSLPHSLTPAAHLSWMSKIKGMITGQESAGDDSASGESFTLLHFANQMSQARKLGKLKQYVVGRGSEATFGDAFEKQEAIIRYLGGVDPTGDNIQPSHKQEAAKQCNCTILDVENTLSKFLWAKGAQKKLEQLQSEGKPIPKTYGEIKKLMGSSPLDVARSNMAKGGQTSRNSPCPCGSKKLYKRCCGKDKINTS